MAQHGRQDANLLVKLSPSLASLGLHNPPGVNTGVCPIRIGLKHTFIHIYSLF